MRNENNILLTGWAEVGVGYSEVFFQIFILSVLKSYNIFLPFTIYIHNYLHEETTPGPISTGGNPPGNIFDGGSAGTERRKRGEGVPTDGNPPGGHFDGEKA